MLTAALAGAVLAAASFTVSRGADAPADQLVSLPHDVVEDAEAWQKFTSQAGAVSAGFGSGPQVRAALKTGCSPTNPNSSNRARSPTPRWWPCKEGDFVVELRREGGRSVAATRRWRGG